LRLQGSPRITRDEWWWVVTFSIISVPPILGLEGRIAVVLFPLVVGPVVSYFLFKKARELRLHEHGIVAVRWIGKPVIVLFDGLASVVDVTYRGVASITLRDTRGNAIVVDRTQSQLVALFDALYRRFVVAVREEATDAIDEGETLHFGPITLSRASISVHGWEVSVDNVDYVHIDLAEIKVVADDDQWGTAALVKVPYPFVLAFVLQRVGARVRFARDVALVRAQPPER
jgi:hypothetical protein